MAEYRHQEQDTSAWCVHACLEMVARFIGRAETQHDFVQGSLHLGAKLGIDYVPYKLGTWGLQTLSTIVDNEREDCTSPEALFDGLRRFAGAIVFVVHEVFDAIVASKLKPSRFGPAQFTLHAVLIVAASDTEVLVYDPYHPSLGQPVRATREEFECCWNAAQVTLFRPV